MLELAKTHFIDQLDKHKLHGRINALVGFEKNLFIRILPLFLKTIAFKIGYNILGESINSCSISNLGICKLPTQMQDKILDVDFINAGYSIATTLVSVKDHTNILLSSPLKDLSLMNFYDKNASQRRISSYHRDLIIRRLMMRYCKTCKINYDTDLNNCLLCGGELIIMIVMNLATNLKSLISVLNLTFIIGLFIFLNVMSMLITLTLDYMNGTPLTWSLVVLTDQHIFNYDAIER